MGELFAHFKGWDVQAIRKESYEEALIELHDTVYQQVTEEVTAQVTEEVTAQVTEEVTAQVTKEVTEQVTAQVTESDIQKLLTILHNLGCSRETAIEQMMEQYQLTQEAAAAKVDGLWDTE